jgi:hypothetical protein
LSFLGASGITSVLATSPFSSGGASLLSLIMNRTKGLYCLLSKICLVFGVVWLIAGGLSEFIIVIVWFKISLFEWGNSLMQFRQASMKNWVIAVWLKARGGGRTGKIWWFSKWV